VTDPEEGPHSDAHPRRWLILGSGGAGKSTFARRLGQLLGLPVIHLDLHYWNPGWVETEKAAWAEKVTKLASQDAWVMDGNYSGTLDIRLPRAETVILLDPPPWRCVWRIYKRRYFSNDRPDIPKDCPDRIDLLFLWWVASYRWRSRPRVTSRMAARPDLPFRILRSDREVERFLVDVAPPRKG
jgi:adenylate kinase family enzyme